MEGILDHYGLVIIIDVKKKVTQLVGRRCIA